MQKMLQQVMTALWGHIEFEAPRTCTQRGRGIGKDHENRRVRVGYPCVSRRTSVHKYPVTQGHEVSGKIAALGEGVTGFPPKQKVTHRTAGLLRSVPSVHARQVQSVRGAG